MKAVLKKPSSMKANVVEIDNSCNALQEVIGGHFEALIYSYEYAVILLCDEAGKLKGLDYNFPFGMFDYIAGNALFVAAKGDDFCGLNELQIDFLMKEFSNEH